MPITEIYIKLTVNFADDPKVAALNRFGHPDAGLARGLYVEMVLYCRRLLTDGFVPSEQLARIAYPAPPDTAKQLAKHLASVGLIRSVSNAEQPGYQVLAYCKRNGTRKSIEELSSKRADAGRLGGQTRRSKARGKQSAKQNRAQTEKEEETEVPGPAGRTGDPPFLVPLTPRRYSPLPA